MRDKERRMPGEGSVYHVPVKRPGKEPLIRWIAAYNVGTKKHTRILSQADMKRLGETDDGKQLTARQARRAIEIEMERRLKELVRQVKAGRDPHAAPVSLGDFLHRWHEVYATNVGPSQAANTAALIERHIVGPCGMVPLSELRPSTVESLLAGCRSRLSSQTTRHIYNLLAVSLDAAVRDELIPRNPVRLLKAPTVTKQVSQPWTFDEANRFLAATRDDHYFAAYALSLAVPIRQGELLGLRWSQVDLERLTLRISEQLQRRDVPDDGELVRKYVRVPTKTATETTKAIDEDIAQVLREHKARQDAARPVDYIEDGGDGLVFLTPGGYEVNGSSLYHRFLKLADKAGVRQIRWHDMRHSAITFMAEMDVHPNVAQKQAGHASVATTLGIYTHTGQEQGREAARRVTKKLRVAG